MVLPQLLLQCPMICIACEHMCIEVIGIVMAIAGLILSLCLDDWNEHSDLPNYMRDPFLSGHLTDATDPQDYLPLPPATAIHHSAWAFPLLSEHIASSISYSPRKH